jgi:hypothetical protein
MMCGGQKSGLEWRLAIGGCKLARHEPQQWHCLVAAFFETKRFVPWGPKNIIHSVLLLSVNIFFNFASLWNLELSSKISFLNDVFSYMMIFIVNFY